MDAPALSEMVEMGEMEGDEMTVKPSPNWLKWTSNGLKEAPNRVMFWAKQPHFHRNSIGDNQFRLCHEHDTSKASSDQELRPIKSTSRRLNGRKTKPIMNCVDETEIVCFWKVIRSLTSPKWLQHERG